MPLNRLILIGIQSGSSTLLRIVAGNINKNKKWQWYKDSCGGTPVDTGTTLSVTPSATTTYYVRAENGCAAPENCAGKTIYVVPGSVVGSITVIPPVICPGDTVTIAFTANVPANTYVWNWDSGTVINGGNAGSYKVVYASGATIHLRVNNGTCSALFTASPITFLPHLLTAFSISKTIGCSPLTVAFSNHSQNATS